MSDAAQGEVGESGESDSAHTMGDSASSRDASNRSDSSVSGAGTGSPTSPNSLQWPVHLRGYRNLTFEHAQELYDSAIPPEIAAKHGVYSAHCSSDLPAWSRWTASHNPFAVLVYPMQEPDGRTTGQVKPQKNTVQIPGNNEYAKYLSPNDKGDEPYAPQLPAVRVVACPRRVLIVEGVKQALAVDAWAPADCSIFRICGITGWSRGGVPTPYLYDAVRGHDVVIIPDADAATNPQVYGGAEKLGAACLQVRATSVRFVRVAASGTAGVDDVLGKLPSDDRRRQQCQDWIETAAVKPADSKPKASGRSSKQQAEDRRAQRLAEARRHDERPVVHIGEERLVVIEQLDRVLQDTFDGTELFRHGDSLARLIVEEHGPVVVPLDSGSFNDLITQAAITVSGDELDDDSTLGCTHPHAWPDANTLLALLSRYRDYQPLDGVSSAPIMRSDGSVVTEPGYDPETRMYVHLSEDLVGLAVPESPTDDEVSAARDLLLDDLLVDFLLKEQSDVAHAVGGLLSPMIRSLTPTCPFIVVNGLQRGVGKGMFLGTVSTVVTGYAPQMTMLPDNEDEVRKRLTSELHAGSTFTVFDETHKLDSAVLNGCVTAASWADRKLGKTHRLEMPNRTCFYFAGNQVQIHGDAARRSVQVRLHTNEPDPENRDGFKHRLPDWASENRREILQACLTLIRAWFDRGQPDSPRSFRFGSFEKWQDIIGGILHVADIPGFLEGMDEQRQAADFEGQYWAAHLQWLAARYGVGPTFIAKEVAKGLLDDEDAETPPGLEFLTEKPDPRALGTAWSSQADRWRDGLRLVNRGKGQAGRTRWALEEYTGAASTVPPALPTSSASGTDASSPATAAPSPASVPDEPGRPMPMITDLDEEE